jgi:hypothetical protein
LDAFELFVARSDELSRMRIIRTQGLGSGSISAGANRPAVFRSVEPDEEDLRSYLLTFRRFVSQSELLHIESIHGLCHKHFTSDELLGHIRACQQGWKDHVLQSGFRLNINGPGEPKHTEQAAAEKPMDREQEAAARREELARKHQERRTPLDARRDEMEKRLHGER